MVYFYRIVCMILFIVFMYFSLLITMAVKVKSAQVVDDRWGEQINLIQPLIPDIFNVDNSLQISPDDARLKADVMQFNIHEFQSDTAIQEYLEQFDEGAVILNDRGEQISMHRLNEGELRTADFVLASTIQSASRERFYFSVIHDATLHILEPVITRDV